LNTSEQQSLIAQPVIISLKGPNITNQADSIAMVDEIAGYIGKGQTKIILDFSKTELIDSTFLGALVSILKIAVKSEGDICLCAMRPQVCGLFKITRLYRLFKIFDTTDQALESFS